MAKRKTHYLKVLPQYYEQVRDGSKRFEVRRNDRSYNVGDILSLNEWTGTRYTGKTIPATITCILDDPQFCKSGYVVLGIKTTDEKLPNNQLTAADLKSVVGEPVWLESIIGGEMSSWMLSSELDDYIDCMATECFRMYRYKPEGHLI